MTKLYNLFSGKNTKLKKKFNFQVWMIPTFSFLTNMERAPYQLHFSFFFLMVAQKVLYPMIIATIMCTHVDL